MTRFPHACTAFAIVLACTPLAWAQSANTALAKPSADKPSAGKPKAVPMAQPTLSAEDLALAERVHTGRLPCELGATVNVEPDAKVPGYFRVATGKHQFHMSPVATTTGAIRLEDKHAGAVWLQLANKSMLMSQKLGTRLADECIGPAQAAVAQALKTNPAVSPLDKPAQ